MMLVLLENLFTIVQKSLIDQFGVVAKLKVSQWCSLSKLFLAFSLQDICLDLEYLLLFSFLCFLYPFGSYTFVSC